MSTILLASDGETGKRRKLDVPDESDVMFVTQGDVICPNEGVIKGHGTYIEQKEVVASSSGVVERVNKLITVRPLRHRYIAEVGDVVVARIVEVGVNRWKVDIKGHQNGVLMLSSVHLPGGIQRRRTQEDQLNMRKYYAENDIISAEVQTLFQDGSVSLHTRSLKYGKLVDGQLLSVPPTLVRRCKQHFHTLDCGVDLILGRNGYIWLQEHFDRPEVKEGEAEVPRPKTSAKGRANVARVHNAIKVLEREYLMIYPTTIMDVYTASLNITVPDMLLPDRATLLTDTAKERKGKTESKAE